MNFSKVIIIGKGKVARACEALLNEHFKTRAEFIEFDAQKKPFFNEFFANLKNALIISANNFYLFSPKVVEQNTIINYHNALLPKHRGVNAHIWAIYEGDLQSGISWHLVDSGIDTGDILAQKAIKIDENTTAKALLMSQHKLAISAFKEALMNFEAKKFTKQRGKGEIHKSKTLPNNAILELAWEKEKISRFLRAFDIGAFREGISLPKLEIFGKKFEVLFYEISQKGLKISLQNGLYINIKDTK